MFQKNWDAVREYESTGSPKYAGDCFHCRWPVYEGVRHECPSAPRMSGVVQTVKPTTVKISKK